MHTDSCNLIRNVMYYSKGSCRLFLCKPTFM